VRVKRRMCLRERECFERFDLEETLSLPCRHIRTLSLSLSLSLPLRRCYGVASVSRLDKILGLFCEEPYKTDDILPKRPIILSILLTVATP